MKCTILGVKKGKTKTGKESYTYYATKDFTPYELENAECVGSAVVSEFSYQDFHVQPGDEVDFQYEPGFEGKATLVDVIMRKPNPFTKESGTAEKGK